MNALLLTGINLGVLWRLVIIRLILTGSGEIARKHATQVEKFVLQKLIAILMMKFAFLLVNLIRIVLVATNAPMAIVLNLAQMTITVLIMNNIVTSKTNCACNSP